MRKSYPDVRKTNEPHQAYCAPGRLFITFGSNLYHLFPGEAEEHGPYLFDVTDAETVSS
jgi:hypothetical protein